MKKLSLILCILAFAACTKETAPKQMATDFESLMGNELPAWKYVRTREDFQNLAYFKNVYEQNIQHLKKQASQPKIAKTIHFIWVGPNAFPRESIENVRSWIAKHPDWTVKFWTDRSRPLPHPDMELCSIKDLPFQKLQPFYNKSDNYGEMSDLLRLEILYREGGIYVDHDVTCIKNFDEFNTHFDLFCGMEVPYPTTLSSSVLPTNNLIGAREGHPLLAKCMNWLEENWDRIEKDYPGKDRDAIINRVSHRTFCVLGEMFKQHGNQEGNVDIALPTYYFNSPSVDRALYAQHQYKGTWFDNESAFEKNARKRLMMLSKKTNKLLLATSVIAGLNIVGFIVLALMIRKPRQAQ